jgi:hypothetical protein
MKNGKQKIKSKQNLQIFFFSETAVVGERENNAKGSEYFSVTFTTQKNRVNQKSKCHQN